MKGWKEKLHGVLTAAVMATTPNATSVAPKPAAQTESDKMKTSAPPPAKTPEDLNIPIGQHPIDTFLKPIACLESSCGKFTDHRPQSEGIHEDTAAVGEHALMPATAQDVSSMFTRNGSTLRQLLGPHYKDAEAETLAGMDKKDIETELKKNPKLRLRMSRYLALHLNKLHNGDALRSAFGWRFGHRKTSTQISDRDLENSGYVKKFKQFLGKK